MSLSTRTGRCFLICLLVSMKASGAPRISKGRFLLSSEVSKPEDLKSTSLPKAQIVVKPGEPPGMRAIGVASSVPEVTQVPKVLVPSVRLETKPKQPAPAPGFPAVDLEDAPRHEAQAVAMNTLTRDEPVALHMDHRFQHGPPDMMIFLMAGVTILLLLVVFLCHGESESAGADLPAPKSPDPPEGTEHGAPAGADSPEGTWARTFKHADKQNKEAIELLFRCKIISEQEFAHSEVSLEHIEECLWIASHMLTQKSLEEWTASWQHAKATFAENPWIGTYSKPKLSSRTDGGYTSSGGSFQNPPALRCKDGDERTAMNPSSPRTTPRTMPPLDHLGWTSPRLLQSGDQECGMTADIERHGSPTKLPSALTYPLAPSALTYPLEPAPEPRL